MIKHSTTEPPRSSIKKKEKKKDEYCSMTKTVLEPSTFHFNPYSASYFVQKMSSAYNICCIYSNALQTNFIMEANTMNPDQTAPNGSSLIWVHIICSKGYQSTQVYERTDTIFVNGRKRVNTKHAITLLVTQK